MTTETVTIPLERYIELLENDYKVRALERGGVDNWEWYGDSMTDNDGWHEVTEEEARESAAKDMEKAQ